MPRRLPGRCRSPAPALLLLMLSACAGPTTQLAPLPPGAVKAEQEKQRELALHENDQQQVRLDNIAYPILVMGAPLCPNDRGLRLGARFATIHNYEGEWQPAAARALGLGDTLTVVSVTDGAPAARAGVRPGDRIVAVGNTFVPPGAGSMKEFTALLTTHQKAGGQELSLVFERGGQQQRATIHLDEVCDYSTLVVQSGELNAYADGEVIYLTSTMMRFVDNDELRVVIAHEFAHNAMGHIKARKKNSLLGALLGALGDIAMAARGFNTGGYYTSQGAKLGAMTFSQDFEREADYVGLYALTLADLSIDAAPRFWRHMAQADSKSIGFAHSHPTTAERFVRMEQGIAEIEQKIASKQPLEPDRAGTAKLIQPQERAFAEAPSIPGSPSSGELYPIDTQGLNEVGEGRSSSVLERDPRMREALSDVFRLGMVTDYREVRPGLLVLTVGPGFAKENAAAFHLGLLHVAYSGVIGMADTARLELWKGDSRIGEYTQEGLTLERD